MQFTHKNGWGSKKIITIWLVHRGHPGAKGQVFKEVVHGKSAWTIT